MNYATLAGLTWEGMMDLNSLMRSWSSSASILSLVLNCSNVDDCAVFFLLRNLAKKEVVAAAKDPNLTS